MDWIRFGGHRGSGCTDSEHARSSPAREGKPPENTLESIARAFEDGADFVEVDVLRTQDEELVVTHSNRLSEHVWGQEPRAPYVGDLTWRELEALRTGPERNGGIPTLEQVLELAAKQEARRSASDFVLNIEIKDVKGTDAPKAVRPSLVELLARKVRAQGLPVSRIVFSSFALSDLMALKKELPEARLGLLFAEDDSMAIGQECYPASPEAHARYLRFTPQEIQDAAGKVRLEFVHPELHSVTPEAMRTVAELKLGMNCWALRELPPAEDRAAIFRAIRLAREHRVRMGLITDFVPEMRAEVSALFSESVPEEHRGLLDRLSALAGQQELVERAREGCGRWLRNEPERAPCAAEDIRVELGSQALVFKSGLFPYPYIDTRLRLFADDREVGHYRFITLLDGTFAEEYLVFH